MEPVKCLSAAIDEEDNHLIKNLLGIPQGCPSGKIQLKVAEEVGKHIGSGRIGLKDFSYFGIFSQYTIRTSMLKTLL